MPSQSAIETRWHHKGLWEVFVQADRLFIASILWLWLLPQCANGIQVALLGILWRCYGDLTLFLLRIYQNAEQWSVLFACSKCAPSLCVPGDPIATINVDADALLRRIEVSTSIKLLCTFAFLNCFRTQHDRLQNAASIWQSFKQWLQKKIQKY